MPDEIWMEVCDTVQDTGIKTIPKKKKCKKAKWLSEEALQMAVKRREAKSKGEKETYSHLNAFPKNSKKPLLSLVKACLFSIQILFYFQVKIYLFDKPTC